MIEYDMFLRTCEVIELGDRFVVKHCDVPRVYVPLDGERGELRRAVDRLYEIYQNKYNLKVRK